MTVIVGSKNFNVTAAIRQFIEDHAGKLFKVHHKISKVRVHLESVERKQNDPTANQATIEVEVPGKDVVVTKRAVDMYTAIGQAIKIALRDLRKKGERLETLRLKGRRREE